MSTKVAAGATPPPNIGVTASSSSGGVEEWENLELEVANLLMDFCQFVSEREITGTKTSTSRNTCSGGGGGTVPAGCLSWGRKRRRSQPLSSFGGGCSSSGGGGCGGGGGRVTTDFPCSSTSPTSPLEFKSAATATTTASTSRNLLSGCSIIKASSNQQEQQQNTMTKKILQKEHDTLTKKREKLIEDFAEIESHREELIARNKILKAKKQKLNSVTEDRQQPPPPPNTIPVHSAAATTTTAAGRQQQQQFIKPVHPDTVPNEQSAVKLKTQLTLIPNHHGSQFVVLQPPPIVGRTGIPDLNISAEEYAAMDWLPPVQHQPALDLEMAAYHYNRWMAKERRRNRVMMIQKRKSTGKLTLGNA